MTNLEKLLIERLNHHIERNFDNPNFSADDICQELGISRSQLYRLIKEEFQLSTSLYIRRQKLLKSKDLLENSSLKIAEISYKIGIDSPQNFSKYFTQEFGINPTEFRKNIPLSTDETTNQLVDNQTLIKEKRNSKTQNPYVYIGLTLLFLLIISFAIYFWKNSKNAILETNIYTDFPENSIAILPFKNLGDAQKSYFSEGIMEQIHSSLASLNDLKVISTTSSNKYSNTKKSIRQISHELHVKYILNGSVLQVDKQIRITVELINAKDDRVIWSKNFEGDTQNIFSYMTIVSKDVVGELDQKLNINLSEKLDKKTTQSLAAYNDFLQGQQLLQTRTSEKVEVSIIKFDQAIKLDPTFADAFTNKSIAYFLMAEEHYMDVESAYKMSENNALTAIRLDSKNGRAYAVLANIYKVHNKWEQALTTLQIALKFSPNDAQIIYWYSLVLRSIGQMDEAIKYSTKAVSLDPLAINIYGGHIIGCVYAGRLDIAEKAIKDGELLFNDSHLFRNAKAFYNLKKQKYASALEEFIFCKKQFSNSIYYETFATYTKAKLGQSVAVKLYLDSLPKTPENYKYFAIVYAGLGNKELCLKYLELAAEKSDSPNYIKVSLLFTFLHNEPRFNAVLQKLGLLNPAFSENK